MENLKTATRALKEIAPLDDPNQPPSALRRVARGDFAITIRDTVRMLEDLGIEYVLVGANALMAYNYLRDTRDVDFLVSPSDRDRIMAVLTRYGFRRAVHSRTKEPSPITILHETERVPVQFVVSRPELLRIAHGGGQVVRSSVLGVPVVVPTLGLLVLSKLVAGRSEDEADVKRLILLNPELMNPESEARKHVFSVIESHSRANSLLPRYETILRDALRDHEEDPWRFEWDAGESDDE